MWKPLTGAPKNWDDLYMTAYRAYYDTFKEYPSPEGVCSVVKATVEMCAKIADECAKENWGFAGEEATAEGIARQLRALVTSTPSQGGDNE